VFVQRLTHLLSQFHVACILSVIYPPFIEAGIDRVVWYISEFALARSTEIDLDSFNNGMPTLGVGGDLFDEHPAEDRRNIHFVVGVVGWVCKALHQDLETQQSVGTGPIPSAHSPKSVNIHGLL
jgi:hypothetical protein